MVVVVGVAAVAVAVVGCRCLREQERAAAGRCWSSAAVSACEAKVQGFEVVQAWCDRWGEAVSEVPLEVSEADELVYAQAPEAEKAVRRDLHVAVLVEAGRISGSSSLGALWAVS